MDLEKTIADFGWRGNPKDPANDLKNKAEFARYLYKNRRKLEIKFGSGEEKRDFKKQVDDLSRAARRSEQSTPDSALDAWALSVEQARKAEEIISAPVDTPEIFDILRNVESGGLRSNNPVIGESDSMVPEPTTNMTNHPELWEKRPSLDTNPAGAGSGWWTPTIDTVNDTITITGGPVVVEVDLDSSQVDNYTGGTESQQEAHPLWGFYTHWMEDWVDLCPRGQTTGYFLSGVCKQYNCLFEASGLNVNSGTVVATTDAPGNIDTTADPTIGSFVAECLPDFSVRHWHWRFTDPETQITASRQDAMSWPSNYPPDGLASKYFLIGEVTRNEEGEVTNQRFLIDQLIDFRFTYQYTGLYSNTGGTRWNNTGLPLGPNTVAHTP